MCEVCVRCVRYAFMCEGKVYGVHVCEVCM